MQFLNVLGHIAVRNIADERKSHRPLQILEFTCRMFIKEKYGQYAHFEQPKQVVPYLWLFDMVRMPVGKDRSKYAKSTIWRIFFI